ncbi:hypothetical protein J6590_069806 [Homalodisca vitripennis]|nr:hypothetical protein J6590_069806 [Homalodisca vitripennis]
MTDGDNRAHPNFSHFKKNSSTKISKIRWQEKARYRRICQRGAVRKGEEARWFIVVFAARRQQKMVINGAAQLGGLFASGVTSAAESIPPRPQPQLYTYVVHAGHACAGAHHVLLYCTD